MNRHQRTAKALTEVIRILGHADVEFALIVYPEADGDRTHPIFIASDPPPKGVERARAGLDDCALLDGTMTVNVPETH